MRIRLAFGFFFCAQWVSLFAQPKTLSFVKIGKVAIQVEIVRTEEEWAKGLMFREQLGAKEGMLFLGNRERMQKFWMKNTPLALDIIFISKDLKIVSIHKNAEPLSEQGISSLKPAQHILEILVGSSDRLGIKTGDHVQFIGIE